MKLFIAAMLLAASAAAGCASNVAGTCAVLPVGQNEGGVIFFRYQCQPEK